jgi:hypothetical protein
MMKMDEAIKIVLDLAEEKVKDERGSDNVKKIKKEREAYELLRSKKDLSPGRKPINGGDTVLVKIRIPREDYESAAKYAEINETSKSEELRKVIRFGMDHMDKTFHLPIKRKIREEINRREEDK